MPILTKFPGGGGASDYVYPLGDVLSPDVQIDANGNVNIKWGDPEDSRMSEWKGTIVVAKQGAAPQSVDDGVRIAETTTRDQYRNSALVTTIGGVGYYYGIFPYTKDYVTNNREENIKYADGGILQYARWADIAAAAEKGEAPSKWAVGDEKTITLLGEYNLDAVLRIAGFDHDKDNSITFEFKTPIGANTYSCNSNGYTASNIYSLLRTKVKDSLPPELQAVLAVVQKKCCNNMAAGGLTDQQIWLPSVSEINGTGYSYNSGNTSGSKVLEGDQYAIYAAADNRKKGEEWWTRSIQTNTQYSYYNSGFYYVNTSGSYSFVGYNNGSINRSMAVYPMFCV